MFSQSDEDEIIADIFDWIGTTNKRFVEFGCGDGRQNNTIALLMTGWSGIWCEPHKRRCLSARERLKNFPVQILRRVITPEKVNLIVKDHLDFLSIDIDGNDYAVWAAVTARPRVVCIEVDEVNGTSCDEMKRLGYSKGYEFFGCSASGVNAFFVGEDL